jgi:3-dehydroquinate dehydratase-2
VKILILNGPNLNLLGTRETDVYGSQTFASYFATLVGMFPNAALTHLQSNVEGELINALHHAVGRYDGVVLNGGGYTHTSVALRDAIAAIKVPVVEVHISNILAREEFRHTSLFTGVCVGIISGFGLDSYRLAIDALAAILTKGN